MQRHPLLLTIAIAALLSFATGCGKTKTNEKKTGDSGGGPGKGHESKKPSKPAKERLVGTWNVTVKIDDDKALADLRKKTKKGKAKVTDEQLKQQINFLKEMVESSKMSRTMNADGTTTFTMEMPNPFDKKKAPQKKIEAGKWEVLSEVGMKATIKVTPTEGRKKDKPMEFKITFTDDKTFRVDEATGDTLPPGGTMIFTKQ